MASSSEQEFIPLYRARLNCFPRHCRLWDSRIATCVGDKLALCLQDIRVSVVSIDLQEELSRPLHLRQLVLLLFDSVRHAGVLVHGAEKLWVTGSVLMSSIRNGRALLSLNLAIAAATITNVCQATVVSSISSHTSPTSPNPLLDKFYQSYFFFISSVWLLGKQRKIN